MLQIDLAEEKCLWYTFNMLYGVSCYDWIFMEKCAGCGAFLPKNIHGQRPGREKRLPAKAGKIPFSCKSFKNLSERKN